ncbi:MAG TPA: AAA family ATPase [Actinomycetota bacterium]|nr:AAA family ATPase [Actinomycetota bacterium]
MADSLSPLVGRVHEQRVLREALLGAAVGFGRVVLIEGEAGIGKSRLAQLAVEAARTLGLQCFEATASELSRHRPFAAIADALGAPGGLPGSPVSGQDPPGVAALTARLASLMSGDTSEDGSFLLTAAPEAEFRIIDHLVELVELRSAGRPMLMVLEDLHWADPSTLLALNRLLKEVPVLPCVIVATMQPLPLGSDRRSLREQLVARGAVELRLGRLGEDETAALVGNLLGVPAGPRLLAQLRRAGGNPFFASELVDALERAGAILRYGGVAELATDEFPAPESVGNAIVDRVSFISEEILETLQVAAILGSPFSVTDLAASTGRKPAALGPLLAAAMRAGILGEAGTRLAFRHDLIREVLYQRMDPALRSWIHLAVAHVLQESGHPREEVAGHVARGAQPGDHIASELLRNAARDVASRSPGVAAELLEKAIEVAPEESLHRAAARADLASYRLLAGQYAGAEAICRELIEGGIDPSLEGQVRCCLVESMIGRGGMAESLAEIDAAIGSPALDDSHRARLLSLASTCRAAMWDAEGALSSARRALEIAERAGDDIAYGVALANLSAANSLLGNFQEAVALAESGLSRVSAGTGQHTQPFLPLLTLASALVDADRPADAQQLLERSRHLRLNGSLGWNHPVDHIISGIGRFWSGDWDEALASLSLGLEIGETTGVRRASVVGRAVAALIALHRGDLATAEQEVAAAEADYKSTAHQWRADWMFWARALTAEAAGQRGEALQTLVKAWELCRDAGVVSEFPVIGPDLVRLAVACGEKLLAEEATAALEQLAAPSGHPVGVPGIQGAALRCRGLVSGDAGVLLEAVASFRRSPRRRALALACEDAAVALTGQAASAHLAGGSPQRAELTQQAGELAEEAIGIYRRLEAHWDIARARTRLRSAGLGQQVCPPSPVPQPPPLIAGSLNAGLRPSPLGVLTEAEAQVAAHVAQGLSNRQIAELLAVSPRTVQSHVSHALHKLGLGSRVELAVLTSAVPTG